LSTVCSSALYLCLTAELSSTECVIGRLKFQIKNLLRISIVYTDTFCNYSGRRNHIHSRILRTSGQDVLTSACFPLLVILVVGQILAVIYVTKTEAKQNNLVILCNTTDGLLILSSDGMNLSAMIRVLLSGKNVSYLCSFYRPNSANHQLVGSTCGIT